MSKTKKTKKQKLVKKDSWSGFNSWLRISLFGAFFAVGILVIIGFASRGLSKNFILGGVKLGDVDLGQKSYQEAAIMLQPFYENALDQTIVVDLDGHREIIKLDDLGVKFDMQRTMQSVYDVSYGSSLWRHLQTRILGMSGKVVQVPPVFEIDRVVFSKKIAAVFPEVGQPRNAEVIEGFFREKVDVVEHKDGVFIDENDLYEELHLRISSFNNQPIDLESRIVKAKYRTDDAKKDAALIKELYQKQVNLQYPELNFEHQFQIDPNWFEVKFGEMKFDRNLIAKYLEDKVASEIDLAKIDLVVKELPEGVGYVAVEGEIRDGYRVDVGDTVDRLLVHLAGKNNLTAIDPDVVDVVVMKTNGKIVSEIKDVDLGAMELISQGRSNFRGSPAGRSFNVDKGISEKMNNIIIPPGESFGFNAFLGPVTLSAGWKNALAIFNAKDLEPVPGGGLCQVSTTVYRAALNAGLNITEQRNHSLYVKYYKEYGNGLDATIYPGQQDLKFVNDTGNYILMRSWTDGDDAYVNFYGTKDGRIVELIGPMYYNDYPEEYKGKVNFVSRSQIGWAHKIKWPDGREEEKILMSSYKNPIAR